MGEGLAAARGMSGGPVTVAELDLADQASATRTTRDAATAARLWAASVALTGVTWAATQPA